MNPELGNRPQMAELVIERAPRARSSHRQSWVAGTIPLQSGVFPLEDGCRAIVTPLHFAGEYIPNESNVAERFGFSLSVTADDDKIGRKRLLRYPKRLQTGEVFVTTNSDLVRKTSKTSWVRLNLITS